MHRIVGSWAESPVAPLADVTELRGLPTPASSRHGSADAVNIQHPAVRGYIHAMVTVGQFAEAMHRLTKTLARPRTAIIIDGVTAELAAVDWPFPTWVPRRRPFDQERDL